jgi:hypothetical protein
MWCVIAAMDVISYIRVWRGYTCVDEDGMHFILGGVVFGVQQKEKSVHNI